MTITYVAGTGGSVTSDSETLNPETGVARGSTATADAGYVFVNWTDADGNTVGNNVLFVPDKDEALNVYITATYYANFEEEGEPATYTVTVAAAPKKGGSVTGGGIYNEGDLVTVTATANQGYKFVNWSEDGVVVSMEAQYTFTMNAADRNLVARYEAESKGKPDKPDKPGKP